MKKVYLYLSIVITLLLTSCTSRTIQEIEPPLPSGTTITYNANIHKIFEAKCTGCHAGGSENPNLETFAEVKEATKNGQVICRINGNCGDVMPQSGKMSQQTIDLIELWRTQGYLEQ